MLFSKSEIGNRSNKINCSDADEINCTDSEVSSQIYIHVHFQLTIFGLDFKVQTQALTLRVMGYYEMCCKCAVKCSTCAVNMNIQ